MADTATPGMTTTAGGTTKSGLSDWAQPYIVGTAPNPNAPVGSPEYKGSPGYLTKAKSLGAEGYQAYGGPLTAGASDLQTQAFQGIGGLTVPGSIGQAANTAGNVANQFAGMSYDPTQFSAGTFGAEQAQQYMNPYLQSALNPQLEEARRQSQITQLQNAAKSTQAGAFGGSRQALMDTETQRALGSNLANITGQGYNTAYQQAMGQYNADQTRQMQAQQAQEASKQFGANYGLESLKDQLSAAQAQGQLGLTQNTANLANMQQQLTAGDAQRKIESEGVAADLAEFNQQREFPYKQIQFQRDILSGLPVSAITSQAPQMNDVAALVASMGGMPNMLKTAQGDPSVKKLLKYLGLDLDEAA